MRRTSFPSRLLVLLLGGAAVLSSPYWADALLTDAVAQTAGDAPVSGVADTRHNFGANRQGAPTSYGTAATGEVCVFCHTPHGAITGLTAPLWNRASSPVGSYTLYSSMSLDGTVSQPGGDSRLCLSCHDGTLAPGSGLSNTPGSGTNGPSASMTFVGGSACDAPGTTTDTNCIPTGTGGNTRRLGTDLRNDHPIGLPFNTTLVTADGEVRQPPYTSSGPAALVVALRQSGVKPKMPLIGTNTTNQAVECNTCHDPHVKWPAVTIGTEGSARDPGKFLRLPRFQQAVIATAHNVTNDQICIGCHVKSGWVESAHVNDVTANEAYTATAAGARDFPAGLTVRQGGCLNCHDTHTETGARRLLRGGVSGANSAIENTCYQCHNTSGSSAVGTAAGNTGLRTPGGTGAVQVPDIWTEFQRTVKMPLTNTPEAHEIRNGDFEECRQSLGNIALGVLPGTGSGLGTKCNTVPTGTNANRHVECTDCHNPHRVRRGALFYSASSETANDAGRHRTHIPANGTLGALGNVASGALRGTWGVQPVFPATVGNWPTPPSDFLVKKGDPGASTGVGTFTRTNGDAATPYLTREYQLCFKCHSNYATTLFPTLGGTGGTSSGTNGLTRYTNTAAEFGDVVATDPPTTGTDQGEEGNQTTFTPAGSPPADSGELNTGATNVQNHRSWHPVMWPTGRTRQERTNSTTATFGNIRAPFNVTANIGYQTMHCSDCHGSSESWTQGTGPDLTRAQGPHGSGNNFLLKGIWTGTSPTPSSASGSNTSGSICGRCHSPTTGAGGFISGDASHNQANGPDKNAQPCVTCHMAIPHGWKNKAFLVNLGCVGDEVSGYAAGCTAIAGSSRLTVEPYYLRAAIRIHNWRKSTSWQESSCGSRTAADKDGMAAVCDAP